MADLKILAAKINEHCSEFIIASRSACFELTLDVKPECLVKLCTILRDHPDFDFKLLVDICGIDYLHYGLDDWETQSATEQGFSRGVTKLERASSSIQPSRFAVIYHLLSLTNNQRLR